MTVRKPLKPCNAPSCRNLTSDRYCDDHRELAKEQERHRHKQYDKYKRDQESASFYKGKPWELLKQMCLTGSI